VPLPLLLHDRLERLGVAMAGGRVGSCAAAAAAALT
jgi:hypothetical protein